MFKSSQRAWSTGTTCRFYFYSQLTELVHQTDLGLDSYLLVWMVDTIQCKFLLELDLSLVPTHHRMSCTQLELCYIQEWALRIQSCPYRNNILVCIL
jgi:hypothetical protein